MPLVRGRRGVLVSCRHLNCRHASCNSPELSINMCLTSSLGARNSNNDALVCLGVFMLRWARRNCARKLVQHNQSAPVSVLVGCFICRESDVVRSAVRASPNRCGTNASY
eukprot:1682082-Pyramimonas_sp.AAC.1